MNWPQPWDARAGDGRFEACNVGGFDYCGTTDAADGCCGIFNEHTDNGRP